MKGKPGELSSAMQGGITAKVEDAKAGFSDNKQPKIKILGTGELTKKFTVKVPCSASVKTQEQLDSDFASVMAYEPI